MSNARAPGAAIVSLRGVAGRALFACSLSLVGCGGADGGASTTAGDAGSDAQDGADGGSDTATSTAPSACGYAGTFTNTAAYAVTSGSASSTSATYTAADANESAVCVMGAGASLSLESPTIVTTGASGSTDDSSFYGLNAGALAYGGGALSIRGGSVTTHGLGGNGVFAYGVGSVATLTEVTIAASADGGHGVEVAGGGAATLTDVLATTEGQSSSVVATDRGGGTIHVIGGTFVASGKRSAGIYSTGGITGASASFVANAAEAVVVEGLNTVALTDCTLTSTNDAEQRGVFVYQSFSGDASVGTGTFSMKRGAYQWKTTDATGAAFFVANTTAVISLEGVAFTRAGGYLLHAAAVSGWGTSGSNGGKVTFTAIDQTIDGDVDADAISTIDLHFSGSTAYTGAIGGAATAKSLTLALAGDAAWNVTGASRLSSLTGVAVSGGVVTNVRGGAQVCYATSFTDAAGALHAGETLPLTGGGTLAPCG